VGFEDVVELEVRPAVEGVGFESEEAMVGRFAIAAGHGDMARSVDLDCLEAEW